MSQAAVLLLNFRCIALFNYQNYIEPNTIQSKNVPTFFSLLAKALAF